MEQSEIQPYVESIVESFGILLNLGLKAGRGESFKSGTALHDITGVIQINGWLKGYVALTFPKEVALKMVSGLLRREILEGDPYLSDGVGELVNIVAGSAKRHFSDFNLTLSLPQITSSPDLPSLSEGEAKWIPLSCPLGKFAMLLSLHEIEQEGL